MGKIIEKIQKIKTLSEQGIDGEAKAAKLALEKLLQKHDLTLNDLESEEKKERCFIANGDNDKAALLMCTLKILGEKRYKTLFGYKGDAKCYIELTDYEFVELSNFYNFHKRNMRKEFKQMKIDFQMAYQLKHRLVSDDRIPDEEKERYLTPEQILKLIRYANEMQDVSFYKALPE